jgi:glycosyltransferase involved in cell wall biosynthesis
MTEPVVLHVSTAKTWRGGEQQLAYLAGELKKTGIKQYVLCVTGSAVETFCIHSHVPYFSADKRSSVDIFFAQKIASICRKNKISIVHTHDSHAHTFAVLANDFFGNRSSIIVSRRVDFPVSSSFFSRYKYNHSAVKYILCVSDKIREITSAALKRPEVAVTVHSGIDISRFRDAKNTGKLHQEFGLSEKTRIVGNIAALAPHKDYFTFVDTVAIICRKDQDVCFFMIGDGPLHNELKSYVKQSGFASRIIMTGFRTDIPSILPEFDVFLITSETEGLGTSILDAFACGVPVAATDAGGIPEIVIHDKTGLVAPVKDSVALARNVERLLADRSLAERLVSGAAEHLRVFSTGATASATMKYYRQVPEKN